jgi:hypothetical protein
MFGSLFGGIAITFIIYFMLIKGAKGATFMKPEFVAWRTPIPCNCGNLFCILYLPPPEPLLVVPGEYSQNHHSYRNFALAMAFAGNDLVNFIGYLWPGWNPSNTLLHQEPLRMP